MYERSIGTEHRIYAVTVPSSATLAINLLSPTDLADYTFMVTTGYPAQPYINRTGNQEVSSRSPVDGYIYSDEGNLYISTSALGSSETIPQYTQYPIPVFFWLNKTWFRSDGQTPAIIRVFFG